MKYYLLILSFIAVNSFANDSLFREDPEPRVPESTDARSEERELLNSTNHKNGKTKNHREVKQNQEEIDPVFYDSTTSPAEMNQ